MTGYTILVYHRPVCHRRDGQDRACSFTDQALINVPGPDHPCKVVQSTGVDGDIMPHIKFSSNFSGHSSGSFTGLYQLWKLFLFDTYKIQDITPVFFLNNIQVIRKVINSILCQEFSGQLENDKIFYKKVF